MATPEPSHDLHDRLTRVEDAVQELRFVHMAKTDAQSAGLGALYAQQQRMQQELSGFRAETTVHLGVVDSRLATIEVEQARQGEKIDRMQSTLEQILRRLSS